MPRIDTRSQRSLVVELYTTPERTGFVAVKLKGYRADHDFLKHLPGRHYDSVFKRWWIPADGTITERVRQHYASLGAKIIDRIPRGTTKDTAQPPSLAEKRDRHTPLDIFKKSEKPEHPHLPSVHLELGASLRVATLLARYRSALTGCWASPAPSGRLAREEGD